MHCCYWFNYAGLIVCEFITRKPVFSGEVGMHELYEAKWKVSTGEADFAAGTVRYDVQFNTHWLLCIYHTTLYCSARYFEQRCPIQIAIERIGCTSNAL
jgi:hypothetical protein